MEETSENFKLKYGVPQGSILGPQFFTLYTVEPGDITRKRGLVYHVYADDTQLYVTFLPTDIESFMQRPEACGQDTDPWMVRNRFKLNGDKTEVLHKPSISFKVSCDYRNLMAQISCRLGVFLDTHLSRNRHKCNMQCGLPTYQELGQYSPSSQPVCHRETGTCLY